MAKVKASVPRGMRDILPEQMIRRQYVIDVIRSVFEEFGFEPLKTQAIELSKTLLGKYGQDAERLIYHANYDEGKQELALRYDLSVPLCRVVAMHPELHKPFKRYQIAPVWRADRPQKGRYREFYQCDADTVGSSSMLADAETINVIHEILTRLGFKQFVINVNNRKILNGIGQFSGVPQELLGGLYRSIDKLDKIGTEGVRSELRQNSIDEEVIDKLLNLLQIRGENKEILAALRERLASYPEALEGITELEQIVHHLDTVGVAEKYYKINFAMVRGLEYYTGPIYETMIQEPKMPSITGGGRFDNLVGMFMDRSYPAAGTTIGIERIIDAMEEMDMFPPDVGKTTAQVLVTMFDASVRDESLRVAALLRRGGIKTQLYFEPDPLRDQIGFASSKGIPFVVIFGPDELVAGKATVRNMWTKQQEQVSLDSLVERINNWIGG